jgi:hypothetical protein
MREKREKEGRVSIPRPIIFTHQFFHQSTFNRSTIHLSHTQLTIGLTQTASSSQSFKMNFFISSQILSVFLIGVKSELNFTMEKSILAEAFVKVSEGFFSVNEKTLNLITSENDFKDEIFDKNSFVIYQQNVFNSTAKQNSIFVVKNFNNFNEIYLKINPKSFKFSGLFLIVLVDGEIKEIEEIFMLLWKKQILNVIIMHEDEHGEILVKTFFPFNPKSCNDTKAVTINRFRNGNFENGLENFFPEKLKNLHHCKIGCSVVLDAKPSILSEKKTDGSLEIGGRDGNLAKGLANALNFSLNFKASQEFGFYYDNGSAKGALKDLIDGKVEFSISNWFLKENRMKFFDASSAYYSGEIVFVIPPPRPFSKFEKFIFPFSFTLWIFILVCLVVGIVAIFIIKTRSKFIQNLVFGENVKNPNLNLFIGFIGGAQNILPKNNFARFLLMIFLLYSLIIRAVYQSSFYELLSTNKHHKTIQSIDEIIEKKFTIFCPGGDEDLFQWSDGIKSR